MFDSLEQVKSFLDEDIGSGDLTASIIPEHCLANANVVTRETMVMCGQAWFAAVFQILDPAANVQWLVAEGDDVAADTRICELSGKAAAMLTAERTALNLLQTLSAVATIARQYSQAVAGTGCKILDTRKTLPGLRTAQKYAVKCGGCCNHRIGLYDGILIKENHIIAAGSIANAVAKARLLGSAPVEVEVESIDELQQALAAKPDRIMLDNFSIGDMLKAVAMSAGKIELEASGNVSLDNVRDIAETGVDFISVGALTKNILAIDLSMRIQLN